MTNHKHIDLALHAAFQTGTGLFSGRMAGRYIRQIHSVKDEDILEITIPEHLWGLTGSFIAGLTECNSMVLFYGPNTRVANTARESWEQHRSSVQLTRECREAAAPTAAAPPRNRLTRAFRAFWQELAA